jgi:hypothetical protein
VRRLPRRPEDWPHVFVARLNAGELDGVAALYQIRTGGTPVARAILGA